MYFYRLTADAACERDRIAFPDASHWAVPGRGLRAPLDRLNDNVRRGLGDNESWAGEAAGRRAALCARDQAVSEAQPLLAWAGTARERARTRAAALA